MATDSYLAQAYTLV